MVKKFYLITTLVFFSIIVFCQNEKQMTDIETIPVFDGDLVLFIQTNLLYPKTAIEDSLEGTVIVELWVDTTGITYDHSVIKGIREDLDKEAIRVSRLIKFVTPAKQRGKPIIVRYLVPVKFSLSSAQSQHGKEHNCNEIVSCLESWPSYNKDEDYKKLTIFLKNNLHYDDTLSETKVVYVRCVVDTLGYTHHHEVTRGVSPSIDQEAIRICKLVKFDKPAMQNGRPVSVEFTIPVRFEPKPISKPKPKQRLFKLWK